MIRGRSQGAFHCCCLIFFFLLWSSKLNMIPCVVQNEDKKCIIFHFFAFLASFTFIRSTLKLNLNANNTKKPAQISRYLMAPVATFRQTLSDNHILLFDFFLFFFFFFHMSSLSNALISIHTLLR